MRFLRNLVITRTFDCGNHNMSPRVSIYIGVNIIRVVINNLQS